MNNNEYPLTAKRYLASIEELKGCKKVRVEFPDFTACGKAYLLTSFNSQWTVPQIERIEQALFAGRKVEILDGTL